MQEDEYSNVTEASAEAKYSRCNTGKSVEAEVEPHAEAEYSRCSHITEAMVDAK